MVSKSKGKTKPKAPNQPPSNPEPVVLRVGPVDYEVYLFHGHLELRGHRCLGLADMEACRIYISDSTPLRKRIATFWHELGHAIICECGCRDLGSAFGEEEMCNILGVGMSALDADTIARVYELLSIERGNANLSIPKWGRSEKV